MSHAMDAVRAESLFGESRPKLVEVVLPLPLDTSFTYSVPESLECPAIGARVIVPFGKKKFYTAIVTGFPRVAPTAYEIKPIAMVLDTNPVLKRPQLELWKWVAEYYVCAVGDVYKAAVPAGLKLESETFVEINPDYSIEDAPLGSDHEAEVVQLLTHAGALSLNDIVKKIDRRGTASLVNRLIQIGVLIISEKLVERYRPKVETYVAFNILPAELNEAFASVKGAKKQEQLLMAMLQLSGFQRGSANEVPKAKLLETADVSQAVFNAVVQKGILKPYKKEINRFKFDGTASGKLPELSEPQRKALHEIHSSWHDKNVTLLNGVTSSGKTEIYMHLIDFVLSRQRQALLLVPEIALTTQLTRRLQAVFGQKVLIYHSKFSDNERVDIWNKLLSSTEPCVVIGARSAVFLPFTDLGLVIVDEEHDSSYKQFDPAPRYNGRDVATVLARMHGAKVLLGTATPSVETYWKALNGKFGLVSLDVRYGNVALPEIEFIDLRKAQKAKTMMGPLTFDTVNEVRQSLDSGAQSLIFRNRRGYAPMARCKYCAYTPKCDNCDVSLTYHHQLRQLQCHYCGAVYSLPALCPQCQEPSMEIVGYGTERIQEELETAFPNVKMLRMDLDSTRSKTAYLSIIDDFAARKASILVGTQMITKGLDFGGVQTVVVVSADDLIHYPDFRSEERTFNMLEQVAGRAGRTAGNPGKVLIQTYNPEHPVLQFVQHHDYQGFYNYEIAHRQNLWYPPFSRLIFIYLKHRDRLKLQATAQNYANHLRQQLGNRVFGPEEPSINRIQNLYIRRIMLKIEPEASVAAIKSILRSTYLNLQQQKANAGTIVYFDVDPQ